MSKKDILKRLIYEEELEFENLVPKVEKLVKIKKNGSPVIVCNENKLTQKEIMMLYIIGKFFAKQLGLSETESAFNKEIAEAYGLKDNVVGARITELKDDKYIEKISTGEHKVSTVKLEEFLDKLLAKLK